MTKPEVILEMIKIIYDNIDSFTNTKLEDNNLSAKYIRDKLRVVLSQSEECKPWHDNQVGWMLMKFIHDHIDQFSLFGIIIHKNSNNLVSSIRLVTDKTNVVIGNLWKK